MKSFLTKFLEFDNLPWKHWLFVFVLYALVQLPAILRDTQQTNLAVYQAKALLDGRLDIQDYYWDAAAFEGRYYVSFPPFPAILVLPLVAIFDNINSVLVSMLLTFLSMYLLYRILKLISPHSKLNFWIFIGFFFGTSYWYAVLSSHHINGFAHVVGLVAIFLFFLEILTTKRPVLIGLYLAAAFLSRQMMVFYGLLLIHYFWLGNDNKRLALKNMLVVGICFIIPVVAYLAFNYYRFNNFWETGYQYLNYAGFIKARVDTYGLFSYKYIAFNFYNMFIKGHNLVFEGDMFIKVKSLDLFGASIFAASPFLIFAIKAKEKRNLLFCYWITICAIIITVLMYHNNGWMQVNGHRFTLDFIPALLILIALAHKRISINWFAGLVIYAIALNILSFYIHAQYR